MSVGSEAMARAEHAKRWKIGDAWNGETIEAVAVTTDWHIVLTLHDRFVRLAPDDTVVDVRARAVKEQPVAPPKTDEIPKAAPKQETQPPEPASLVPPPKPGQQELF